MQQKPASQTRAPIPYARSAIPTPPSIHRMINFRPDKDVNLLSNHQRKVLRTKRRTFRSFEDDEFDPSNKTISNIKLELDSGRIASSIAWVFRCGDENKDDKTDHYKIFRKASWDQSFWRFHHI